MDNCTIYVIWIRTLICDGNKQSGRSKDVSSENSDWVPATWLSVKCRYKERKKK